MLTQEFFISLYSRAVCLFVNYFLYCPMIPTQTLCSIVSAITKQNPNVESLKILDFWCCYPLPQRPLVILSSLLTTIHLRIGFIFELSQHVLFMPLQFLSQIQDSSECLHFRKRWFIHMWLQSYIQIIRNRNQYLHQVFVQFFWREISYPLIPSMMNQLPPQSQIPNENLLFHRCKSRCLTHHIWIEFCRHFKCKPTTRWVVLIMKLNFIDIILCCIFILLFKGDILLPMALHKLVFQSTVKSPLVFICIIFWC